VSVLDNDKPEKLLVKIPRRLWKLMRLPSIAFCCLPRDLKHIAAVAFMVSVSLGVLGAMFYLSTPLLAKIVGAVFSVVVLTFAAFLIWPTIFIRKDCLGCQFGFYIIAHERNHLLLKKSEEIVEEETLKQNGDRLVPLLIANPQLCKDCKFIYRKMFCQATFEYLKKCEK
jgi:hypothetical protein